MADYRKVDKFLSRVGSKLKTLTYLHPTNLVQEEKKFLKDKNYNPLFRYPKLRFEPEEVEGSLRKIRAQIGKSSVLDRLYREKINVWLEKIKLLRNIGNFEFTKHSVFLYSKPSKKLAGLARKEIKALYRQKQELFRKPLSLKQMLREFRRRIKSYNLSWQVKLKNISSRVMVRHSIRTVFINKDAEFFSLKEVQGVIAHEIETHVLRRENGENQSYKIFAWGLPGYETTEEGLAVFNQDMVDGAAFKEPPRRAALRVVGVDLALGFSFSEVYRKIKELGADHKLAFSVAFRTKRGLADTSQSGGFTKDYIYFKGRILIKDFIKKGGALKSLYTGKVGIRHLSLLKKIPGLKKPKYLPHFYDKRFRNS